MLRQKPEKSALLSYAVSRVATITPPGPSTSVLDGAALAVLSTTTFLPGALAYVRSRTTIWSYQPTDLHAPDGNHIPAQGGGNWVYQSAGNPNAAAATTDWYWDPAGTSLPAGSDDASGAIGAPLSTWAEVIRRYGRNDPTLPYGSSVTLHQLTTQSAGIDPIFFYPNISGGGKAVLVSTLIVKHAAFVGGAVAPKSAVAGGGTLLSVTGFPAGTAAGDYVFDQTRNSYAPVDSVTGGGVTVTMTQPLSASILTTPGVPLLSEDNTWGTGDTFIVYTRPSCNLKMWRPKADDVSDGGVFSCGWVQWVKVADSSGTNASEYPINSESSTNVMSGCQLSRVEFAGRGYLLGCDVLGTITIVDRGGTFYGGVLRAGGNHQSEPHGFDGDIIIHGVLSIWGALAKIVGVYCDGSIEVRPGSTMSLYLSDGAPAIGKLWGPGSLDVSANGVCFLTGGTWGASLLLSGAITLNGVATGTKYVAGVWTDGVAITTANLDAFGGLQSPRTGARFC